jgi:D-3-phosphoglycerate dehydrogenase
VKIAILDDYQHVVASLDCYRLLQNQDVTILHHSEPDTAALAKQLTGVEALVLTRERTAITDALLPLLPALRLISQTGKISNHLDLAACTRHGVAVAEGVGLPIAPAELTWALLMNVLRQIPQAIAGMQKGEWQTNLGTTVYGKTIGIWGYGKIGKRIAGYARAFGAEVLVWGSETSRQQAIADGHRSADSKTSFFKQADVVSLHLRLTESTNGIVTAADLACMKPNAALINTARAELIAPGALLTALQNGRPGFAGMDVYEQEPVYDIHYPLLQMPNVVCTPHLGYVEQNSYELYFGKAFDNVLQFIAGQPQNIANPEVLKA